MPMQWFAHYGHTYGPMPTLKKVTKTCEVENPRRTRERNVVTPPLRTAGPMTTIDSMDLLSLVPVGRMDFSSLPIMPHNYN